MKLYCVLTLAAAFLCLGSVSSIGSIIVYGTHADHPIEPGGDLADVQMTVDLFVTGGEATMTFTNTSVGFETTAVLAEIVVDMHDDDPGGSGPVLWDPVILTETEDVAFTWGDSNGLPGYHSETAEMPPLLELSAQPAPPKKGLGIGESLQVKFDTSLPDGPDRIADYLAFFNGGSDTEDYTIGFHAISAATVGGQSLSGIYHETPEPGTMVLIGLGGVLLLVGRKRRKEASH